METVTRIQTPSQLMYLIIKWEDKSFELLVIADELVLEGIFSEDDVTEFSEHHQLSKMDYFDKVKNSLNSQNEDYIYELKELTFSWKKREKDGLIKEGLIDLAKSKSVNNNLKAKDFLIEKLMCINKDIHSEKDDHEKHNMELQKTIINLHDKLQELQTLKSEMEQDLYVKFVQVLNTKKRRNALLQETLRKLSGDEIADDDEDSNFFS